MGTLMTAGARHLENREYGCPIGVDVFVGFLLHKEGSQTLHSLFLSLSPPLFLAVTAHKHTSTWMQVRKIRECECTRAYQRTQGSKMCHGGTQENQYA